MATTAGDSARQSTSEAAPSLPLHDRQDFEDAERGLLARGTERQVRAEDGRVVWDLDAYTFLEEPSPDTANPSLWRQGQLLIKDGLFAVIPGIYQVLGYDLSIMTLVEGNTGVIVIDPLICRETAAAAFALYTPWAATGGRDDLYLLPHRPLRRSQGCHHRGGRQQRPCPGDRP